MHEIDLTEILKIAQDGEVKLRDMSNYATIMSEKWRVKANASIDTVNISPEDAPNSVIRADP